jgi:hypothetical protein
MAFDTTTRKRLSDFVADARRLLTEEFAEQLQSLYGVSVSGDIAPLERLTHLDAEGLELAATLRQRIAYLTSASPEARDATKAAVDRLTREQAFTVLNRLAAIRMAEKRGLIVESVGQQYQSKGFKVFESVAGSAIGETYDRYRCYLSCLFDELAIDLGALFDRRSPQALLFPREKPLLALLGLLDETDLQDLWAEDETIGWIYQYYNDPVERKKMREESAAPRNSRELAVRNQFFTPRYVVEFLTDNTLGRIWYEMTQGATALKEQCRYLVRRPSEIFLKPGESAPEQPTQDGLSQEDLLKQPVFIPHRPLKDPRSILMLDPACGSMHFGLYAFDLFEAIYDEAWEIATGSDEAAKSGETFSPFSAFAASFSDKAAFQREVPRMIVEHNLHGIDIDPRASQIAGLSLWLRAQRAWNAAGVKPVDRPRITRSNIVCAEPMPGDKSILAEFVEQQFPEGERAAFRFLLETVFDRMTLAGEAGSLLKIEEEIRTAIAEAKKLWQKEPQQTQRMLFTGGEDKPADTQKTLDLSGITDEQFWLGAEERIYAALRDYAEQAETGSLQRRLFADDAARGFAFIDVCRKRYEAVVMNPPFGLMRPDIYRYAVEQYPNSYCDFGIAFMDRGIALTKGHGIVGAITSRSYMSVTDAEKFRVNVAIASLQIVVDLGLDVMDGAWVDSSAQVFSGRSPQPFIHFVKTRGEPLSPEVLLEVERHVLRLRDDFRKIPRARLSYDVEGGLENLLSTGDDGLEDSGVCLNRTGASTFEDERFRRLWWEVAPLNVGPTKPWCYVAKSCEFNLFYYPYDNLVKWAGNGDELAERNRQVNEQTAQARQGSSFYFKPGLSFSRRGEPTIAFRTYPADCAFSSNGAVVLPTDMRDAQYLLGFLNSSWVRAAIYTQAHKFSYSVGHPKSIAWIAPSLEQRTAVAEAAQRILERKLTRFRRDERDNYFVAPFNHDALGLRACFNQFTVDCERMHAEMLTDLRNIDRAIAQVYSLDGDGVDWGRYNTSVEDVSDPDDIPFSSQLDFAANVLSYILGIVFGRWDILYATGVKAVPQLPDPFAGLRACPPGQLQNSQRLPARREDVAAVYPVSIPWDGILVDDSKHPLDIERRIREVIGVIWSGKDGRPSAEAIELEACDILGVKSLCDYFRKPGNFFADHLKRYSKSRRQAPIYWPLSTKSGSYTLWIYYHRLDDQTLHKCLADFLDPRIKDVESELGKLTGKDSGRAADLRDFLNELKDLRDEIERVIKLPWKPNLNDGVLITAAPLWKLFRLSKWQKDLKACWEELEKGDYDWSHLAYTIWPERVEKVCEKDRSIAIAHGLEHLCKVEPPKPKKPRGKKASS